MRKYLVALGAALAGLGMMAQVSTANAGGLLGSGRSPNVFVGQVIAGGGMTAAYLALTYRNGKFAKFTSSTSLKWWGLTTVGCFALSPIVAGALVSANERRELRSSEVFMMLGDCVVPILGGWIMQAAFDAHPEWDKGTGLRRR